MGPLQSLPGSVQFADYSTTTAATSHAVSITTANLTIRNSMILGISYDGATGNQVSGITDTDGNTWTQAKSGTNSTQTNGELWYCTNLAGGTKPTITVATSSSVKATIVLVEVTGIISYKTPLDVATTRVYTTAGVGRFGTATGIRNGQIEAIFQMAMANNSGLTFTGGTSGFNGATSNFHTYKDGTTGLSVAYCNAAAESLTLASKSPGFVVTPSSSIPAVVLCAAFYRQGVSTGVAGDGALGNTEAVVIEDNSVGRVYKSSASAPLGGTGGSTDSKVYSFIPGLDLPAGVTVASAQLNWTLSNAVDDGFSSGYYIKIDPTAPIGTTLETTDENGVGGSVVLTGSLDLVLGAKDVSIAPSDVSTGTTYMNTMYYMDTSDVTASEWQIGLRANNTPNFVEALLTWPSGGRPRSFGTIIG